MENKRAFANLERIGRGDLENYTDRPDIPPLDCDAYEAFRDFIRFGFYRNRKDELADMYIGYAWKALEAISSNPTDPTVRVELLRGKGRELSGEFKRIAAEESKDVHPTDMKFLQSACDDLVPKLQEYGFNIRRFCIKYLRNHDVKALHEQLDDVKGIGSKIASLYLRDMMMLYSKSFDKEYLKSLTADQMKFVYPIDVWVQKISEKILNIEGDKEEIADRLIEKCKSFGVSPIFVNHGIWYIGAMAHDFLLDNLDNLGELRVKKICQ